MSTWVSEHMLPARREKLVNEIRAGRLTRYLEYADGDEEFGAWLWLVDGALWRLAGVTHRDLADRLWLDEFAEGIAPQDAAVEAFQAEDVPSPR